MLCLHLTHQTVAVPAARAPAQITTRQLIELFFSSQAGGHCKNIPTLEYGFLVQVRPPGREGGGRGSVHCCSTTSQQLPVTMAENNLLFLCPILPPKTLLFFSMAVLHIHTEELRSGTENGSSEWCHKRTIFGPTKNLSDQGSLRNHFLKEFK